MKQNVWRLKRNKMIYQKNLNYYRQKGQGFLLGRIYFKDDDGYQKVLVFAPVLNSVTLDNSKRVTDWLSTQVPPEKRGPINTSFVLIMPNRINLKFNNSVLEQKNSSSLYSNFILNLSIVDELNNWLRNFSNNFALKNYLLFIKGKTNQK